MRSQAPAGPTSPPRPSTAFFVADALAEVLTGGAKADVTEPVTSDRVLALEREAFMRLVKTDKTLARIEHTLETGKPLRN